MPPLPRSSAAWMLTMLVLATRCFATTLPTDGYALQVWQTEDGLPQNAASSAVQTRDGYLWIGTYGGLARFNGEQFKVFNSANTPELHDGRIMRLFEDAQGTLWIGHETGAITRYRNGRFERFPLTSSSGSQAIWGLGSDEQGRLWAMRYDGTLDALDGQTHLPLLLPPRPPKVLAWTRSVHGSIWVAENGVAAQLKEGKIVPIDLGKASRVVNYVLCVTSSADGGVWILCDDRIRKWHDGRWTEDRGDFLWGSSSVSCALELHDRTLAVGTVEQGLFLVFPDGRPAIHFDQANGLPQNWVRFLYEDREGNLWVGAGSAGLAAIHPTAFSVENGPNHWGGRTVLSATPGRDGALWVGTEGAGLYRLLKCTWTHYGNAEGIENPYVWAVDEDPSGRAWVGTWTGGPYQFEHGRFAIPASIEPLAGPVLAIENDPKTGGILVGSRDGLLSVNGPHSTWLFQTTDGSPANVCAVVRDRTGVIWFGLAGGGLGRLADGRLTMFGPKEGLVGTGVQCLFSDEDGTLWIGMGDGGISRLRNGHFARIGVENGLASNVVGHIADDGLGYLWLSTRNGIQRVEKEELNRCADGLTAVFAGRTFDRTDGLPTIEYLGGLQAAGCKTADGRLWFTSSKGLVSVDPSRIQFNPTPPPVLLETMVVDGEEMPVSSSVPSAQLPPDHQRLEFHFTGLSFVAPSKILFKYRLDGIDQDWVDARSRRTAFYSRLTAGTYRFRVIACNNDGVWNTEGASYTFSVAPFFWRTWWFIGGATVVALTGVALFVRQLTRRRLQRRMDQLERQNAIERERARIAQDIHDDIGTSLTRIAMFSQPDGAELKEPHQAAAVLARIYATTGEMTRALDEIVWAVDPRHDTLDDLVSYMGRFAQDLLGAANIRCRLDVPVELPPWRFTAEMRHNLFLAFKEALNNTIKHAGATEVRISLHLDSNAFMIVLKDDGRGFDRTQPRPQTGRISSGNGLANLERRLTRIGGQCEIASVVGGGTTISFIVSVPDESRTPVAPAPRPPSAR